MLKVKKVLAHIKITFLVALLTNLFRVDDKFSKPVVLYRGENSAYKFVEEILEEYEYYKKVMKKHFKKDLIMTEKEEEQFQSSKICWICEKLIENDVEKVRDHCQITGKFRDVAY